MRTRRLLVLLLVGVGLAGVLVGVLGAFLVGRLVGSWSDVGTGLAVAAGSGAMGYGYLVLDRRPLSSFYPRWALEDDGVPPGLVVRRPPVRGELVRRPGELEGRRGRG